MPKAEYVWSEEHIIRELDALSARMIVEPPVGRGWMGPRNSLRVIQASRLRESGWSTAGLAALYAVDRVQVERWLIAKPSETLRAQHGRTKRQIWLRICEALALIELGLWCQQPRAGQKFRARHSYRQRRH